MTPRAPSLANDFPILEHKIKGISHSLGRYPTMGVVTPNVPFFDVPFLGVLRLGW